MSASGRHRRAGALRRRTAAVALTATGAGLALPLIGAGTANAASVDVWDKVAQCESGGDWSINTGNGFFGGLQFTQQTWEAFGGGDYAARADQATKDQQIAVAEKVLDVQGPTAWPTCGPNAGLTKDGVAPDISVDGGQAAPAGKTEQAAPKQEAPKKAAAPAKASGETYTVVSGDSLFKIAKAEGIEGGWKKLYAANEDVVGGDPDLIFPKQRLDIPVGGEAAKAAPKADGSDKAAAPAAPAPKAEQPEAEEPKAEQPEAETPAPAQAANDQGFSAPVDAPMSTPYRQAGGSWSSGYHTGVDFSAPTGSTIKAVADATVVSAGWGGSYGNQVVLQHADGHYSQYAHLSSLSVSAGQQVSAGDQLGLSGSTGNSTGPHLHFEVRTGPDYGSDIDPIAYLREHGVTV